VSSSNHLVFVSVVMVVVLAERRHNTLDLSSTSPTCLAASLSTMSAQTIRQCLLSTVGSRTFPVVVPHIWNDLAEDVTSAELPSTFCLAAQNVFSQNHFLTVFSWTLTDASLVNRSSFYYFDHLKID